MTTYETEITFIILNINIIKTTNTNLIIFKFLLFLSHVLDISIIIIYLKYIHLYMVINIK